MQFGIVYVFSLLIIVFKPFFVFSTVFSCYKKSKMRKKMNIEYIEDILEMKKDTLKETFEVSLTLFSLFSFLSIYLNLRRRQK